MAPPRSPNWLPKACGQRVPSTVPARQLPAAGRWRRLPPLAFGRFAAVDENGVAQDSSTADQLRARGIRPKGVAGRHRRGAERVSRLRRAGVARAAVVLARWMKAATPPRWARSSSSAIPTSFDENIAVGATVGTLSVAGGSGTYTFTLTSNPGSLFVTAGTNGVNLNTAASLTAGSKPVTVQAAGGVPTPVSRALSITVAQSPTIPANTALPVISGMPMTGMTLTTTDGTWTGFPAPTFTYQWKRGGTAISGATANSYLLVSADVGTMITVTVTATNTAGNAGGTSAPVGPYHRIRWRRLPTDRAIRPRSRISGAAMTTAVDYNLGAQNGAFNFTGLNAVLVGPVGPLSGSG